MLLCLQRLLLVVVLLFSQQVASAHAQDHQLKGTVSDQQVCEQCVLAAHLGSAPTSTTHGVMPSTITNELLPPGSAHHSDHDVSPSCPIAMQRRAKSPSTLSPS